MSHRQMDLKLLQVLTNKTDEWVSLSTIVKTMDINKTKAVNIIWNLALDYDGVYTRMENRELQVGFSLEGRLVESNSENSDDVDTIIQALEEWQDEQNPLRATEVVDLKTGDTWAHVFAKRGRDDLLVKLDYMLDSIFVLNNSNQTPMAVASGSSTQKFLRNKMLEAVQQEQMNIQTMLDRLEQQNKSIRAEIEKAKTRSQEIEKLVMPPKIPIYYYFLAGCGVGLLCSMVFAF